MVLITLPPRDVSKLNKKSAFFTLSSSRGLRTLMIASWFTTSIAFGAQVEPNDYEKLLEEAHATGTVRVMVTIDDTITLDSIKKAPASVHALMEQEAKPLLAELDQDALDSGYWNNGMGQIGIYVTPNGLQILANSTNAKAFMPDLSSKLRFRAYGADGSLDAINATLNANGFADVEVFLNVDEGDYDIGKNGKTTFRPSPKLSNQIMTRLSHVNAQRFATGFKNFDKSPSQAAVPSPSFRVRIDKNAFYGLRESEDVRAIRPIDFVDSRPAQWPVDALKRAQADGSARIIISLRGGTIFSPMTGYMSTNALKAQTDAHQRAFDDVLSNMKSSNTNPHFDMGFIATTLSYDMLAQLYENADPRILSIEENRPVAGVSLDNSTQLLNMQPTWSGGYRGAGQYIFILDNGIKKDHELFKVNGTTKVAYEGCYGTTTIYNKISYRSICPSPGANGDSPPLTTNAGNPLSDEACNILSCGHGTHVAGIAAGHSSPSVFPTNLQGVAPDATLVSYQVFSYDTTVSDPHSNVFYEDVYTALTRIYDTGTSSTTNITPFVVNMSFGNGLYNNVCDSTYAALTTVIANLTSRGVPVIAATGNDANRSNIAFPACISNVIKVGSVINDTGIQGGGGVQLSSFSNIANQASFVGQQFLLAPGGGTSLVTTSVRSAGISSTTETVTLSGTSMAAPHVAGYYAVIKGVSPVNTLADVTAWIASAGSISVPVNLSPGVTQNFRRIRVP